MHPVLWSLFGFEIPSFGVMLACGFLAGLLLAIWRAPRYQGTSDELLTWLPMIMLGGIAGAKLLFFIYYPQQFLADPLKTLLYPGGLVWYGGVAGGLLVIGLWCCRAQRSLLSVTDWLAPSGLLGLAFGRVGCFLSGCCFGKPCDVSWLQIVAVQYPVAHPTHPNWVHPVQLYESGLALLLMAMLLWLAKKPVGKQRGFISGGFLLGYALIRFVLEFYRGDALNVASTGVSASQWISLIGGLIGLALMIRATWRASQQQAQPVA
jgi:phosphatidylglycerol:prolipoprotein diacylglycerol transferase